MKAREAFYYLLSTIFSFFPNIKGETNVFDENISNFLKKYFFLLLFLSYTILIIINISFSFYSNTLFPSGFPNIKNFLNDYPNLINYFIICPIYIIFGITFIFSITKLRKKLYENTIFKNLGFKFNASSFRKANIFYISLAFIISIVVISFYGSELNKYNYQFWFQDGSSQIRHAHHIYYLIYNFIILLIVLIAAFYHLELFYIAKQFGSKIKNLIKSNNQITVVSELCDTIKIKNLFFPYVSLYAISKILIFAVLINLYTWKAQNPNFIGMLDLTILAYFILGIIIVSYPRHHIQYWIYKIWQINKIDNYPDIRLTKVQGIISLFDVFVLGAAFFNLFSYMLIKLGISQNVMGIIKLLF